MRVKLNKKKKLKNFLTMREEMKVKLKTLKEFISFSVLRKLRRKIESKGRKRRKQFSS